MQAATLTRLRHALISTAVVLCASDRQWILSASRRAYVRVKARLPIGVMIHG